MEYMRAKPDGAREFALSINRPTCRKVLDCASPLALSICQPSSQSARGLAQSKTLSCFRLSSLSQFHS